jgi:hypothetical protein
LKVTGGPVIGFENSFHRFLLAANSLMIPSIPVHLQVFGLFLVLLEGRHSNLQVILALWVIEFRKLSCHTSLKPSSSIIQSSPFYL